jgi:hypothetical protein
MHLNLETYNNFVAISVIKSFGVRLTIQNMLTLFNFSTKGRIQESNCFNNLLQMFLSYLRKSIPLNVHRVTYYLLQKKMSRL